MTEPFSFLKTIQQGNFDTQDFKVALNIKHFHPKEVEVTGAVGNAIEKAA